MECKRYKSIVSIDDVTMYVIKLHCKLRFSSIDGDGLVVKINITIKRKKMSNRAVINPIVYPGSSFVCTPLAPLGCQQQQ